MRLSHLEPAGAYLCHFLHQPSRRTGFSGSTCAWPGLDYPDRSFSDPGRPIPVTFTARPGHVTLPRARPSELGDLGAGAAYMGRPRPTAPPVTKGRVLSREEREFSGSSRDTSLISRVSGIGNSLFTLNAPQYAGCSV